MDAIWECVSSALIEFEAMDCFVMLLQPKSWEMFQAESNKLKKEKKREMLIFQSSTHNCIAVACTYPITSVIFSSIQVAKEWGGWVGLMGS